MLVPKACEYSPFHSRRTTHGIRVVDFEREREQPALHRCTPPPPSNPTGLYKQRFFPQRLEGPTGRDWQRHAAEEEAGAI